MKVIALSRLFAERWSGLIEIPHAIISIGDPPRKGHIGPFPLSFDCGSKATFADNPQRVDILWMQFYDLDLSSIDEPSEARIILKEYGHGLFTEDHAKQILEFLEAVKDEVRAIMCNCEAGVSRSSGVAAAILRILTGSDDKIFNDPRYIPNRFVYRTILNVWEGGMRGT